MPPALRLLLALLLCCFLGSVVRADDPAVETKPARQLEILARRAAHGGLARCLAFHPTGRVLVTGGSDRSLRFWNVAERREMRKHVLPPSG